MEVLDKSNTHYYVVRKEITLHTTPEKVWEALTQPEMTKHYFFGCKVHSDWKEGGDILFKGRAFGLFPISLQGKITKIDPPYLLQYTLYNGRKKDPNNQSLVTDLLTYENGVTTLRITDDVGQAEGADKRYQKSLEGWDKVLTGLKKLLDSRGASAH